MRVPVSVATLVMIIASCSVPTTSCGCTPAPIEAAAYGAVRTAAGIAVQTATFSVSGTLGACGRNGQSVKFAQPTSIIDSTGQYRLRLIAGIGDTICARVTAKRAAGTTADSLVSAPFTVAMRKWPPDSVRLDFTFP